MKFIPLLVCAIVALAFPACTTTSKHECKPGTSCCATPQKHVCKTDGSCCAKGKTKMHQ